MNRGVIKCIQGLVRIKIYEEKSMQYIRWRLAIYVATCMILLAAPLQVKAQDILVGAEYFSGWWQSPEPNNWQIVRQKKFLDWRSQYAERVPMLGEYSNQETMDKEIEAASAYGVDYFSISWYYPHNFKERKWAHTDKADMLNKGVHYFMQSPEAHKMHFMVSIYNDKIFPLNGPEDWLKAVDEIVIPAMQHPSYLKVDGKPVLKIHDGARLFRVAGKNSVERTQGIISQIRQKVRDAGLGELILMVGHYGKTPITPTSRLKSFLQLGIDGTMQYMDDLAPNSLKKLPQNKEYPYKDLVKRAEDIRKIRQHDALPYVPYAPTGWNPKPWAHSHGKYALFALPTPQQWGESLRQMRADVENAPNFGFPRSDGTVQKSFTIYAWNEFGEGGFLAPTKKKGFAMLEELRKYFGQ